MHMFPNGRGIMHGRRLPPRTRRWRRKWRGIGGGVFASYRD